MTATLTTGSITEARYAFLEDKQAPSWETTMATRQLARHIVKRISDGEPFDDEDFIFAASLGEPERCQAEATTIATLLEVPPGEVVGVVREQKLAAIGLASLEPLALDARVGRPYVPRRQQFNRYLRASVNVTVAGRVAIGNGCDPRSGVKLDDAPTSIPLFAAYGEPANDGPVFFRPHGVVLGESNIRSGLVATDTEGAALADHFFAHLASSNVDFRRGGQL